jgi:hypothetical protein
MQRSRRLLPLLVIVLSIAGEFPPHSAMPVAHAGAANFDTRRVFGTGSDTTGSIVVGDMDGDGDLDMVVGNSSGAGPTADQDVVYLNDGAGNFYSGPTDCGLTQVLRCFGVDGAISRAVGDIDTDGDLDIIATQSRGSGIVYLNDRAGNFSRGAADCALTTSIRCFGGPDDPPTSAVPADVDGDGDLDIIAGKFIGQASVYLNNQQGGRDGYFYQGEIDCGRIGDIRCIGPASISTYGMAAGDMDHDGDLDVVLTGDSGKAVYLNT